MFFQERFQAGSIKGSVFTLVVAIVGAGTLSVPFAIEQSGLLIGPGLFVLGALMAYFSLRILILSSVLTGVKSYTKIAHNLYGPRMSYFAQAMLLLNLYGTCISYIVAAGNLITPVVKIAFGYKTDELVVPFYLETRFIMVFCTSVIVLPLALQRTMGALRYASLIAVFCTCYLSLVVFAKYFEYCGNNEEVKMNLETVNHTISQNVQCFWKGRTADEEEIHFFPQGNILARLLKTIPIVVYAYTCHPNVLPVFMELQKPTRKRMSKVVGRSIGTAMFLYLVLGIFAYLTFKSQLECSDGSFLKNDYHSDASVLIGAVGMSVSVISAIPLFVHAFRGNIFTLALDEFSDPKDAPLKWHFGVSIGLLVAAVIPAILVKDISLVFGMLGSTTNPMICFVLPSMFILRAAPSGMYRTEKIVSVIIATVISIISVISLGNTFFGAHDTTCPDPVN